MTWWVRADFRHISRGNWEAYIPDQDHFIYGTSEASVKANAEAWFEGATGIHDAVFVWNEC